MKKILRLLLVILILILFITIITSTYSKYVTTYDKQTGVGISRWNIKVNDNRIENDAVFTKSLKVDFDNNPNMATNTIAPTRQGTVELVLDSTGTQLPYEYDIKIVDGDVDYESSYQTILTDDWEQGGVFYYQMKIIIDYSHLDTPIWYQYNLNRDPWWGYVYTPVTVDLELPDGFRLESTQIYGVNNVQLNGSTLSFVPEEWNWQQASPMTYVPDDPGMTISRHSNNKCEVSLHLSYDESIDIDVEDFWKSLSIAGKKLLKTNLPDYRIYAYSLNGGEKIYISDTVTSVKGTVQPAATIDEEVINTVLLYVEWYDGPDNIMDNAADVAVTKIDNPFGTVPIGITVTQLDS